MALVPDFISSLQPYVPGKPIEETEREYGVTGAVKLASNENPLGPSPRAMAAIQAALPKLHLYPDGGSFYLKNAVSSWLGISTGELMLGNGSNELIELLIRTFVHGDDEVLLSAGSFVIYKISCQAVGRRFVEVPMRDRHYDLAAMADAIGPRTRMVFIANPDNPTGTYQGREALLAFLRRVPADTLVVMDEAYFEYAEAPDYPDSMKLRAEFPNLVTLRTYSKIYGLAGVRLGYGVARREIVDFVNRTRAPFNVSSVAQVAGIAAIQDVEHVQRTRALNRQGLELLGRELPAMGLKIWPSQTNFYLVDFGRPAPEVFTSLLKLGVIVRPMHGYGFTTSVRINTGTPADHDKLLSAIRTLL
jgi:histidinol-phosphate aminotransferase